MFEGLNPEVEALLDAAAADLPRAQADAGLLAAMAEAVASAELAPTPTPRRKSVLGKVLTAKAAAIAGVLVLTGGVASAATGALPGPAQDVAHEAANVVGLNIPSSEDDTPDTDEDGVDKERADNHGKEVSDVAHDESNEGRDHGAAVCAVASEGKCQPNASDDNSGPGKSAEHRQDGDHSNRGGDDDDDSTTSTTLVDDDSDDDDEPSEESGKGKGKNNSGRGSDD